MSIFFFSSFTRLQNGLANILRTCLRLLHLGKHSYDTQFKRRSYRSPGKCGLLPQYAECWYLTWHGLCGNFVAQNWPIWDTIAQFMTHFPIKKPTWFSLLLQILISFFPRRKTGWKWWRISDIRIICATWKLMKTSTLFWTTTVFEIGSGKCGTFRWCFAEINKASETISITFCNVTISGTPATFFFYIYIFYISIFFQF